MSNQEKPSIGHVVLYRLTVKDAHVASAHPGPVHHVVGQRLPLIVCSVKDGAVSGQVFLDSDDSIWVQAAKEGFGEGQWSWPPRT